MKEEIRKIRIKIHKIMLERMGISMSCFFIISFIVGGLWYRSITGMIASSIAATIICSFGYLCFYMFITPYDYHGNEIVVKKNGK